jgi:hypothetical protein
MLRPTTNGHTGKKMYRLHLSPLVTRGVALLLTAVVLSSCADYACAPARWSGYDCPSPTKMRADRR